MRFLLLLACVATTVSATSPAEAVRLAHADVARLPREQRERTRILCMYHVTDAKELERWNNGKLFWTNSLSTEPALARAKRITPWLWRIDLAEYGWTPEVWELLLKAEEPYFHVRIVEIPVEVPADEKTEYVEEPTGRRISYDGGRTWIQETRKVARKIEAKKKIEKKETKEASAGWVDPKEAGALAEMCQSQIPIVRLDWWIHQVGAAQDRQAGYYNWIGVTTHDSFLELGGTNGKVSRKLKLNLRAMVGRSTVTLNSREIEYEPSLTGAWFRSNDFARSTDFKNPLRLLGGDAKPDAHEEFMRLGNGLWAFGLFDAEGKVVNTAPDNIASDGKARGTDRRVHVGISCVRCHEGLQPVVNWARTIYAPPFPLESPDYKEQLRLRAEYLRDMGRVIARQQAEYADVLKELNGLTPKENAALVADLWDSFELADIDMEVAARELGVEPKTWKDKLTAEALRNRRLDPVLAAMYQGLPIRREHWQEVFALAMQIVRAE